MRSRMSFGKRTAATCALALAVAVGPAARAGGSLSLEEVLAAVAGEAKLVGEIEVELRKQDLKIGEIVCVGARHGSQWRFLGGGRAAPYECGIGDRTLSIEADRTYYDVNGRRLGQLGQAADKVLFDRAKSFRETNFRWTWSP